MPKYLDETGLAHYHGNVEKRPVQTFETVAAMQAATWLKSGMTCHTNGFHAAGDGGAAYYTVGASGTANGMDVLALQGGLFATLVVTEPYVTPEQFGAYGDGTHDDAAAINRALDVAGYVLLGAKTYYCTETLSLTNGHRLNGSQNGYLDTTLLFPTSIDAIAVSGRGVDIGCFRLSTIANSTGKAITFTSESNHWFTAHEINVFDFAYGIYSQVGSLWCADFRMVRINNASTAISLKQGFNLLFDNVYTNNCDVTLNPGSISAKFICCNFGINKVNSFAQGTNVHLSFDTCNFECDAEITASGYVFGLGSGWVKFSNCTFKPNFPASATSFFAGMASTYSVVFNNCFVSPKDSGYGNTNFFAKSYPIGGNAYNVGALKIIGCTHEFPRPDYYSASVPNVIDYDNGGVIHFTTGVESNLVSSGNLKSGMVLMNDSTKKLCYYNGTSLVYFS